MIKNSPETRQRYEAIGTNVGALAAVLPGLFMGITVGGNFGGSLLSSIPVTVSGASGVLTLVGVILGFLFVLIATTAIAAALGRLIALLLWRLTSG